jgi:hypothetical protein
MAQDPDFICLAISTGDSHPLNFSFYNYNKYIKIHGNLFKLLYKHFYFRPKKNEVIHLIDNMMSRRKNGQPAWLTTFNNLNKGAASGDVLEDKDDYKQSRMSWVLKQTPPKNFVNQIYWCVVSYETAGISISNSVYSENNYSYLLSTITGYSNYTALFDQYCIYAVEEVISLSSSSNSDAMIGYGRINTAIDFDNTSNLGAEYIIQQFSNCITSELVPGKSYVRKFKPCVAPALQGSGSGVSRSWINSAASSIVHYGFRTFYNNNTISGTLVDKRTSLLLGFRNST